MTPRWLRAAAGLAALGLTVLVLALLGPALAAGPAHASAEPIGDCTTTSGVVVAVDFAHWGGPVLRSCGTTPTSGYTLLNQGGWRTTGTEHDGPGFICRIGYAGWHGGTQYPTTAQQSCVLTPPSNAYWAYWYAGPGQDTWSYSQSGAMSTAAQPGSVELWTFGGTTNGGTSGSAVPSFSPASVRARNVSKPSTIRHDRSSAPATTPATSPPAKATTPAASTTVTPAASPSPTGSASIVNAPPTRAAAASGGHGSAAPALIALILVVVLAAVGITVAARRPRRDR